LLTIALAALTGVVSVAGLISPAVALIAVADMHGPALAVGTLAGALATRFRRSSPAATGDAPCG
jgi:hypothetical protein